MYISVSSVIQDYYLASDCKLQVDYWYLDIRLSDISIRRQRQQQRITKQGRQRQHLQIRENINETIQ